MRHKALTRKRLLSELEQFPGHVLVCAPSGWGKSILLRQHADAHPDVAALVTARRGDTAQQLQERKAGRDLLIDDAWLLRADVVSELLRQNPQDTRCVLAVRHVHYPRVQLLQSRGQLLVLDALDLAFTIDELYTLHQRDDVGDLWRETQGWPHLSAQFHQPLFRPQAYLSDLMEDLTPSLRMQLQSLPALDTWDSFFIRLQHEDGSVEDLLNTGLPVVPAGEQLRPHPYFWAYLLAQGVPQPSTPEAGALSLLDYIQGLGDITVAIPALTAFFERHGDEADISRQSILSLIDVLQHIGLHRLTPALRDKLAHLLITTGQSDEAREVLAFQRDQGTSSSLTYAMLSLLANFRNDFVTFSAMVPLMHQAAKTDYESALAYSHEALLHLRLDNYAGGLRAAERGYHHAIHAGDLEVHVLAVARLAYYHQMMGNLDDALSWANEAIKLMSTDVAAGKFKRALTPIYNIMGDMLKDSGRHEEALNFVREGLALFQASSDADDQHVKLSVMPQTVGSPVGYLYNQRGLVYTELGRFEDAIEAFEASIDELKRTGNKAAILLPLAYICYPLYRLGQTERVAYYLNALQVVIGQSDSVRATHEEHHSYLPLAEGLHALSTGNCAAAKESFARIRWDGALTYDSTLLAHLYSCKLALQDGSLNAGHAERLAELLDARGSPDDVTAVMFADEFKDVYTAFTCPGNSGAARFQQILSTARQRVSSELRHVIQVHTLGHLGLSINGQPITLQNNYPVYVLTYLALQNKPVTAEDLGEAVWTGKANARRIATTAISMARKTLRDVDQELKNVITDGDGLLHEHTYLLSKRGAWDIQIDAERYLTPAFSAQNPDAQALWRMLEEFAPFLSRASESVFASDINGQLIQRVHAVASHLATRYAAHEPRRAAYALLMALKTDFDPAAVDQLALVAQTLSERDRGIIATYLTLAAQEETMWDYLLREAHFALTRLSDGAALAF